MKPYFILFLALLSVASLQTASAQEIDSLLDTNFEGIPTNAWCESGITGRVPDLGPSTPYLYVEKKIKDGLTIVPFAKAKAMESPVLAPHGDQVLIIGNGISEKFPPTDAYVYNLKTGSFFKLHKNNPLDLFIKADFTPNGDVVACELKYKFGAITRSLIAFIKSHEWEPVGYHSVISFYKNGRMTSALGAKDFGLPEGTFLQHPRVTSDSRWLTFYTQGNGDQQGIYVYNFNTKKTFYMGNYPDKHPTWTADATKILFHEQGKLAIGGDEIARIGFYEVVFDGDVARLGRRIILGDKDNKFGNNFVYQKHPAEIDGLVFAHGKVGSDGKKTILVLSLDHPDHAPIELKLYFHDKKVKHAEHPTSSEQKNSPLMFMGIVDGEKNPRLLSLDNEQVEKIRKLFEN